MRDDLDGGFLAVFECARIDDFGRIVRIGHGFMMAVHHGVFPVNFGQPGTVRLRAQRNQQKTSQCQHDRIEGMFFHGVISDESYCCGLKNDACG